MSLFRVRIALQAPLGTPLTSGTLFGHLCWAKREGADEEALTHWLKDLPAAPWALSDGFPADRLPKPLIQKAPRHAPKTITASVVRDLETNKKQAQWPWLPTQHWSALRARVSDPVLQACAAPDCALPQRIAHNNIDRHTGSTPEERGLYFVDEDWSHTNEPERDVYVRAETTPMDLKALFDAVGETGYGRDATWGRGHFTVVDVTDAGWLDAHAGNRMLSLSHGCLTANMAKPRYKLFTHFGKVGASLPTTVPWKYPILLMRPGATFTPADSGPFGTWLTGVHQEHRDVGHNAYHLAIPFTEVEAVGEPQ